VRIDDGDGSFGHRGDCAHTGQFTPEGVDVAAVEGLCIHAHGALTELAGANEQQVAAEPGEFGGHLGGRSVADRHQGDDGANTDHDPQHGQERPQRIPADRLQSQLEGLAQHQAASRRGMSDVILPSTN
jgi:hypothetical protein